MNVVNRARLELHRCFRATSPRPTDKTYLFIGFTNFASSLISEFEIKPRSFYRPFKLWRKTDCRKTSVCVPLFYSKQYLALKLSNHHQTSFFIISSYVLAVQGTPSLRGGGKFSIARISLTVKAIWKEAGPLEMEEILQRNLMFTISRTDLSDSFSIRELILEAPMTNRSGQSMYSIECWVHALLLKFRIWRRIWRGPVVEGRRGEMCTWLTRP